MGEGLFSLQPPPGGLGHVSHHYIQSEGVWFSHVLISEMEIGQSSQNSAHPLRVHQVLKGSKPFAVFSPKFFLTDFIFLREVLGSQQN